MKRFYQILFLAWFFNATVGVSGIGITYGMMGDNLPPPGQVVSLLRSRKISKVRIFEPHPDILKALENSGIEVILGVRNADLANLAIDPYYAKKWINDHVRPHASFIKFTCIAVGNEVVPGPLAFTVLNAMQNLDAAVWDAFLRIPVTTAVSMQAFEASFLPSSGAFSKKVSIFMEPIATFLNKRPGSPFLVNLYPFFAYASNHSQVSLAYALGDKSAPAVPDGVYQYHNLFHAMVDTVYSALEKVGVAATEVIASETGWPSAGDANATIRSAQIYVNNVVSLALGGMGTPKRPKKAVETYIFALFNEDLKPAGVERNFGLYYPNMTEVYHINFAA